MSLRVYFPATDYPHQGRYLHLRPQMRIKIPVGPQCGINHKPGHPNARLICALLNEMVGKPIPLLHAPGAAVHSTNTHSHRPPRAATVTQLPISQPLETTVNETGQRSCLGFTSTSHILSICTAQGSIPSAGNK